MDRRVYPGGDIWDTAEAKTKQIGCDTVTSVGCFCDGAGPYGALDMTTNVFQWTASRLTNVSAYCRANFGLRVVAVLRQGVAGPGAQLRGISGESFFSN